MSLKVFLWIIVGMLLTSLFLSSSTLPARAEFVTVYIRTDGTIEPSSAPISTLDNVTYKFTDNINGSIVVEKDNIIVDGENHTLLNTGGSEGIILSYRFNVTVKNLFITDFFYGFYLLQSQNNTILSCYLEDCSYGIYLQGSSYNNLLENNLNHGGPDAIRIFESSSYNTVIKNNATNSGTGISVISSCNNNFLSENILKSNYMGIYIAGSYLEPCSNNTIIGNIATLNNYGIEMKGQTPHNYLSGNIMSNNQRNFGIESYWHEITDYMSYIDTSNLVDGRPIYYLVNAHDIEIPSDAGFVGLVNCTNMTVRNLNITSNYEGIMLAFTQNTTVSSNTLTGNYMSIHAHYATYCTIEDNSIVNNTYGIHFIFCSNNLVQTNNIENAAGSLDFVGSANNLIVANNVSNSRISGLLMVSNYDFGRHICQGNSFYHNNFVNNYIQVQGDGNVHLNYFDCGYPNGGNYWSNYNGTDLLSGKYQNLTGSDGLGDTPYPIDSMCNDTYPLIVPYSSTRHDVGITNLTTSRTNIAEGYNLSVVITLTVKNFGAFTETFNITLKISQTTQQQTVTMESEESTTRSFTWNTTDCTRGNYTLGATAESVPYEIFTADNHYYGQVHVGIPGDISGPTQGVYDGTTNMRDINYLILRFNTYPSSPNWNPNADVNNDDTVNMRDIQTAILNFNKHE